MNHKDLRVLLKLKTQEAIQQKSQQTQQTSGQINQLIQADQEIEQWADKIAKAMTIGFWWITGLTVALVAMVIIIAVQHHMLSHKPEQVAELKLMIQTNNATLTKQVESLTASNQVLTLQLTKMTRELSIQKMTMDQVIDDQSRMILWIRPPSK